VTTVVALAFGHAGDDLFSPEANNSAPLLAAVIPPPSEAASVGRSSNGLRRCYHGVTTFHRLEKWARGAHFF
jgi:hypothetical protein